PRRTRTPRGPAGRPRRQAQRHRRRRARPRSVLPRPGRDRPRVLGAAVMTAVIQRLDTVLRDAVDSDDVPAVVAVAADTNGVIYEGAAGPRAVGAAEPASVDTVFRIASMTKIVTTVAALKLRDEGRLDFAAPVDAYCAAFVEVRVLDGFDGDRPRLRQPASRATVEQLVTHTAGFAYGFWDANLAKWETVAKPTSMFDAPMVADPGTRL